jgi:CBS domain-containing protein
MSLAQDLQEQKVTVMDLSEFTLIESGTTVRKTLEKMKAEKSNCAFITRLGKLAGILTDRDVLRRVVDRPDLWDRTVDEVMTHNPRPVMASQTAGEALRMMHDLHFRNAPVLNADGEIVGNLTYSGLIRYLAENFPEEVINLPPEPDQFGEERYGG